MIIEIPKGFGSQPCATLVLTIIEIPKGFGSQPCATLVLTIIEIPKGFGSQPCATLVSTIIEIPKGFGSQPCATLVLTTRTRYRFTVDKKILKTTSVLSTFFSANRAIVAVRMKIKRLE
ncbi:hypothetical protein RRG08_011784 [Elysia crispata]|uniref:Uncharacterized protein n=1 Tax=Elysia crispata TaxID=231223 RepID=A0AAE1DRT5_9GAST|nr:hypothetical protein RRG08_011784 [Elysia crispata]